MPLKKPCPACGEHVTVNPSGTLRKHHDPRRNGYVCDGQPSPAACGLLEGDPFFDGLIRAGLVVPGDPAETHRRRLGSGPCHNGPSCKLCSGPVSEAPPTVEPMTTHTPEPDPLASINTFLSGGRSTSATTSDLDAINAMLDDDASHAYTNASGQPREKTGRTGYLVTDPETGDYRRFKNGNPRGFTRCTTFVKTATDTTGLTDWKQSNVLIGAALRPDLAARAHGLKWADKPSKDTLKDVVAELEDVAGAKNSADEGTLVHELTERIDAGEVTVAESPEYYQRLLQEYVNELERHGLEPVQGLIERTVLTKRWCGGICGTFDRVYYHQPSDTFLVGDVKTGRNVDEYGRLEIPAQMKVYEDGFNAYGVFDWNTDTWVRPCRCWLSGGPQEHDPDECEGLIRVRSDWGVILHMPLQGDAAFTVTLKWADLAQGARTADLCARIREDRASAAKFAVLDPAGVGRLLAAAVPETEPVQEDAAPVTPAWAQADEWTERFKAVASRDEATAVWREARKAGLSGIRLQALVEHGRTALLSRVDTDTPGA